MSTNTILASAPLTTSGYHLKANGTTLGNSLIWDNGTNVGIGNTNTTYKLDVTGTARFGSDSVNGDVSIISNNVPLIIRGQGADSSNGLILTWDTGAGLIIAPSLEIYTGGTLGTSSGTKRMTITSAGNVGIGTSSPSERLYVYNNAGTNPTGTVISVETAGSTAGYGAEVKLINSNSSGRTYGIRSSGPGDGLVGSYVFAIIDYTANAGRLIINSSGLVYLPAVYNNTGGGSGTVAISASGELYRATSSLKYKENVIDYNKGLAEVLQLRPVYYNVKREDDNNLYAGLIAEEIEEIGLTEFVQYAEDGTPDSIYYPNMVALLTKAIQEQQIQIQNLQEQINILAK